MKTCDNCSVTCKYKNKNDCIYVKLEKGKVKLKCKNCSYKTNNWCKLYNKQISLVFNKCL